MRKFILALLLLAGATSASAVVLPEAPDDSFLWRQFNSVQINDSLAFATTAHGLVLLEYNEATEMYETVSHLLCDTEPGKIKIFDNLLIASSLEGLLYFVDISNLPQMTRLGRFDFDVAIHDFDLSANYLYIASGFDGLRWYDASDPSAPFLVDSTLDPIHCTQVSVTVSGVLVLDDYNGFYRYEETPEPELRDILYLPKRAASGLIRGDELVIPLVDRPLIYRAVMTADTSYISDSLSLDLIPDKCYLTDTAVVALNLDQHLLELVGLSGNSRILTSVGSNLGLGLIGGTTIQAGDDLLILPSELYGLVSYNLSDLWLNADADPAYNRPGLISCLGFHQGALTIGSTASPLDFYRFDDLGQAAYDTTAYGFNSVRSVADGGDVLFVHYPTANRISVLGITADSLTAISHVNEPGNDFYEMQYYDYAYNDTASLLLLVANYRIELVGVNDQYELFRAGTIISLETITDVTVVDSFVVVSTVDQQLNGYKIFSNFNTYLWWSIATPGTIDHLVTTGMRQAPEGWFYPDMFLAFIGHEMHEIFMPHDEVLFPWLLKRADLPITVQHSAIGAGLMFTISDQGMGLVDLGLEFPEMTDYGGYSGDMIAFGDSTLAISDGLVVHSYSFKGSGAPVKPEDPPESLATEYLRPNYPNPFNPVTRIEFHLPHASNATVEVFDILGRRVTTLVAENLPAGTHETRWDGTDSYGHRVASGVYLYRMTTSYTSETRKMILLK